MLENCKTAQERWGGTHQIIDRWLSQRQETLVRYFDISSDTAADQQSTLLQAFCEALMDYVSA
ncbi:MAG: Rsd/AlgQ family anti-sigma factor, partial [Saccharospirillum sp.]